MKFISSIDSVEGTGLLADKIAQALISGKKVLWLLSGGSNIPISVNAIKMIREAVSVANMMNVTVALTDERYGPIGHADSNWQQLIESGFDCGGIQSISVLSGISLENTAQEYSRNIDSAMNVTDIIVTQFGIGGDGHIAGILPNTAAVHAKGTTFAYSTRKFSRITLTIPTLLRTNCAFAFAFGSAKREAVESLQQGVMSVEEEPAGILRMMSEAYLFSDQIKA